MKISSKPDSVIRICVVGNQAFSLLNFRGSLIAEMAERGLRVFALAPDFDEAKRLEARVLGAEPIEFSLSRTGMNPIRDAADMLRLALLLRRIKPNMILGYAAKPVIYGTLAAWIAQVPMKYAMIEGLGYVFTASDCSEALMRRALRHTVRMLYAAALRHVDLVFFLNRDDIDEFSKNRLVAPEKAFLLGGIGVNLEEWRPKPPAIKPVTFLLVARLLREKGIVEYYKAARIVKQKHTQTRFILIGGLDSNPGALSHDEIDAWIAEGIIEWPGRVSDVRQWIEKSSVFVLPSYREGVPRSTQEAMAMARPIITTDAPGCRDTVIDGKNGFLVPVRDFKALAAAMEKFIQQPKLIEKMGQASRQMAEEHFDINKINKTILQAMGICKD